MKQSDVECLMANSVGWLSRLRSRVNNINLKFYKIFVYCYIVRVSHQLSERIIQDAYYFKIKYFVFTCH